MAVLDPGSELLWMMLCQSYASKGKSWVELQSPTRSLDHFILLSYIPALQISMLVWASRSTFSDYASRLKTHIIIYYTF